LAFLFFIAIDAIDAYRLPKGLALLPTDLTPPPELETGETVGGRISTASLNDCGPVLTPLT
jgi:hypothetical protein